MRLFFLIRSLDTGGAETQLVNLAIGLKNRGHAVQVAVFYGGGALEDRLRTAGVPMVSLEKRGRWDTFGFLSRLLRQLRHARASVLFSSLEGANIVTALCRPVLGQTRLVWRIAAAELDVSGLGWLSRLSYRLEDWLSGIPDAIIVNSRSGRDWVTQRGFPSARLHVVENGIDTDRFRPDLAAGRAVREELGIPPGSRVVGMVARIDPVKRHDLFLRASARAVAGFDDVHLLCVGGGDRQAMSGLSRLAEELGLSARITWTGPRRDTERLYNAMDLLCSSSDAEGFPNVVAEAMACGVPVIVTDVGDSRHVVGQCGRVVPARDSEQLAEAQSTMLAQPTPELRRLGVLGRERVLSEFSRDRMIEATLGVLTAASMPGC